MAIFWRGFTTRGAVSSIVLGAVSALVLIYFSPTIQVDVLGHADALFPLSNPALISMPLAFGAGIVVSLLWPEREARERFVEAEQQIHLGPALPQPRIRPTATPARGR
jgi:cation/acetate symporter